MSKRSDTLDQRIRFIASQNKVSRVLTTDEEKFVQEATEFRCGRFYSSLINKEEINIGPGKENKIQEWPNGNDTTLESISKLFHDWAKYRHTETIVQIRIYNTLNPSNRNKKLPIVMVDSMGNTEYCLWSYNRLNNGRNDHILFPLSTDIEEISIGFKDSIPFTKKEDKIVFRDSTSGPLKLELIEGLSKASKVEIISKWFGKDWTDFGFTKILDKTKQENGWESIESQINKMILFATDRSKMMKNKFVLCIEGEDISSSLGWCLASNCVPICPSPFVFSSFVHQGLQAGVHYIACKPDGSDLEDILNWTRQNPELCEKIAENGRAYMRKVGDAWLNIQILKRIYKLWNEANISSSKEEKS